MEDIGNYVDILHEYNDLKDTGQALLGQLGKPILCSLYILFTWVT